MEIKKRAPNAHSNVNSANQIGQLVNLLKLVFEQCDQLMPFSC